MSPANTQSGKQFTFPLGVRGEMIAWDFLQRKGYKILEKNFRCKIGEIDVVARKGKRYVFIEIKTRTSHQFGRPEEAVGPQKQRKLIRLAQWYLREKKEPNASAVFEVLAITWREAAAPEIRLIEDAFPADEFIS